MRKVELPAAVISRRALVYVRQSTSAQVHENLESQKRQYALADLAREHGFRDVVTIDSDLGRSGSGTVERPGFNAVVAQLCEGAVGGVFCLEASRLARNGRDWHHLLELCGLVGARVFDGDGAYDPSCPNDRLLLGLKGTMSELELSVLRRRLQEAIVAKAKRGEYRMCVPIGYSWDREAGLDFDPDVRVQEVVRAIFRLFDRLGSARQVLIEMHKTGMTFPGPVDGKRSLSLEWRAPTYRNVISTLQNPCFAGAYAYGKSTHKTSLVDGRLRKRYGIRRPMTEWTVLLREHHAGYITWEQFEKNQERLARNAYRKPAGGAKSGRGGRALLSGLLRCRRCGQMLEVVYCGGRDGRSYPRYSCRNGNQSHGLPPCIMFGARRPDDAIAAMLIEAVQPIATSAALVAHHEARDVVDDRRRAVELERQQAEYDVRIAARRYESVDPDNRLVASQLEARWNAALERLRCIEARIDVEPAHPVELPSLQLLEDLAGNLASVWRSTSTTMRAKQRLVRALIEEIVVDVDDATREVVLIVHWKGGAHSEARARKPRSGEHTLRTAPEAEAVMRDMATKWSPEEIAATVNRMGFSTGQGLSWTGPRVQSFLQRKGVSGYESSKKDGVWVTMHEAAKELAVTSHVIRKLIVDGVVPARQVVKDAPWQIRAEDLRSASVQDAVSRRRRRGGPCRSAPDNKTLRIPGT